MAKEESDSPLIMITFLILVMFVYLLECGQTGEWFRSYFASRPASMDTGSTTPVGQFATGGGLRQV